MKAQAKIKAASGALDSGTYMFKTWIMYLWQVPKSYKLDKCSGSVEECLTQEREVASLSLTRGTALYLKARHFILWDIKNQNKQTNECVMKN